MDKYFVETDGDTRMVMWGDPDNLIDALPMILCPPVLPPELVDQICELITEKDPEGKLGKELIHFAEDQMKAEEHSPEMQGLAPGEDGEEEEFPHADDR